MAIPKKKLFICLISIGCVLLLCLTAAWYMFGVKHIHLPDTIEISDDILKNAFTGKIQEYRGEKYISYYLPQEEAVKKFERNGFKAVCCGGLASHMDGIQKEAQSGADMYLILEDGAYMTNETWYLRQKKKSAIFPSYEYVSRICYQKEDVFIVVTIDCNDPRKPEFKLLLDEIAAYFNDYIEQQNALLMG